MKYIFTNIQEKGAETNAFFRIKTEQIKTMLEKAVEFMRNTKDPSHGIDHLDHLLRDANRFIDSMGDTFDLDQEVLLLSVYWHDVWKSQNKPTLGNYLFQQLYEGLGSMFLFRKYASEVGLSPGVTQRVSYAIRKHSAVQLRPARTLEARLLWDVDTLDLWNSKRIQTVFSNFKWNNISLFDSYILYMRKAGFHLNFEWTKNEVRKISPFFFREMSRFRESLVRGNKRPQPLFIKWKGTSTKRNLNNKS